MTTSNQDSEQCAADQDDSLNNIQLLGDETFPTPEDEDLAKDLGTIEKDNLQFLPNHPKQKV